MAAVRLHQSGPAYKWTTGFFGRMSLPELMGDDSMFHAAWLEDLGSVETAGIDINKRVACLSTVGINILQQRLVFNLTRFMVPTSTFSEAFSHTYEEAEHLSIGARNSMVTTSRQQLVLTSGSTRVYQRRAKSS